MSQNSTTEESFKHEIVVAWGDMDALSHVNNSVYFKYYEAARMAFFEKIGANTIMKEQNIGPILASAFSQFRAPIVYPETIEIGVTVSELGDSRFLLENRIMTKGKGVFAAKGIMEIVYFDYGTQQKTRIPAPLKEELQRYSPNVKLVTDDQISLSQRIK